MVTVNWMSAAECQDFRGLVLRVCKEWSGDYTLGPVRLRFNLHQSFDEEKHKSHLLKEETRPSTAANCNSILLVSVHRHRKASNYQRPGKLYENVKKAKQVWHDEHSQLRSHRPCKQKWNTGGLEVLTHQVPEQISKERASVHKKKEQTTKSNSCTNYITSSLVTTQTT